MRRILLVIYIAFSVFFRHSSASNAQSALDDEAIREAENIMWTVQNAMWCGVFLKTTSKDSLFQTLNRYEDLFEAQHGLSYEEALKKQNNIDTSEDWEAYKKRVAMMARDYLEGDRKIGPPYSNVTAGTTRKCQSTGRTIGFDFLREGLFQNLDSDAFYSKVARNIPVREAVFGLCKSDLTDEEKGIHLAEKTQMEKTLIRMFGKSSFEYLTRDKVDTKLIEALWKQGRDIYISSGLQLKSREEKQFWCRKNISFLRFN